MTNEELDRWLAEKVMGYDDVAGSSWNAPAGVVRKPIMPSSWIPTTNIAQAIEAAEKARTEERIRDWVLLSPAGNSISRPMAEITLDGDSFFSRDADTYSLALCRSLHEALTRDP